MRKILVVIDMQNDFIDGALGTPEALSIVENVKKKIAGYPPADIYATMDTHPSNYLQTQEGRFLPVKHCIRGTDGWQIRPDIAALLPEAKIYEKPTFGSLRLAEDLKEAARQEEIEIELVGLCTDICVISNALLLKAAMPEVLICVDASCCAGVTPEKHQAALLTMQSCQIQVRDVHTIYLAGGCFWGVQKFFDQFDGVLETETGYANGKTEAPSYEEVCAGSGHAETVRITYDASVISLSSLLEKYFLVIDPLSVNRQGGDVGVQYRTGIYYTDAALLKEIEAAVRKEEEQLGQPLAVEVKPLERFDSAEGYHQNYLDKNPGGYCHIPAKMMHLAEE